MRDFYYFVRTASLVGSLTLFAVSGRAGDAAPDSLGDRVTLPVQENAHAVFADDLNGDGHPDLIIAVAGANNIAVYDGHGDATYAAPRYFPVWREAEIRGNWRL